MKQPEERRIYVAVAGTIQVPTRTVVQPAGRQVAQACHVVSKLRIEMHNQTTQDEFEPITTIVLQARYSAELYHVYSLLRRKKLDPVVFQDSNPEYGPGDWPTAIAVYATKKQISGVLDYLPLWGSK